MYPVRPTGARPRADVEVLVAGAGPVGLMAAAELRRHGLAVRIVDRAPGPSGRCKALAVQARTVEVLAHVGLLEQTLASGLIVRAANLYRDGRREHRFEIGQATRPGLPYPPLLSLEQSETERILAARLHDLGTSVEWGTTLVSLSQGSDDVTTRLESATGGKEIRAQWLLGCDGAHSTVRQLMGAVFRGTDDPRNFLLADATLSGPLAPEESHRFMAGERALVIWPIRGERRFFLTGAVASADGAPSLAAIQALVDELGPGGVRVHDPGWLARYRVARRIADRFRVGRVVLAGDAAHVHPTTGGQGLNTGIQDAFNLAWKLALVQTGRARLELVDSYEAERRPVAERVVDLTGSAFRSGGAGWGGAPERIRQDMVDAFSQLGVGYRGSPIVADGDGAAGGELAAGDRAPDGVLSREDGTRVRLFELLARTTAHTLLVFTGNGGGEHPVHERHDDLLREVRITPRPPIARGALMDEDGGLHAAYGLGGGGACLVRPDGYIALLSGSGISGALDSYVARLRPA